MKNNILTQGDLTREAFEQFVSSAPRQNYIAKWDDAIGETTMDLFNTWLFVTLPISCQRQEVGRGCYLILTKHPLIVLETPHWLFYTVNSLVELMPSFARVEAQRQGQYTYGQFQDALDSLRCEEASLLRELASLCHRGNFVAWINDHPETVIDPEELSYEHAGLPAVIEDYAGKRYTSGTIRLYSGNIYINADDAATLQVKYPMPYWMNALGIALEGRIEDGGEASGELTYAQVGEFLDQQL